MCDHLALSPCAPPRPSTFPRKITVPPSTKQTGFVSGNPYRIRDPHAPSLTELWLISAIVTILAIRGFLHASGYPQVGGDTFHIAHMLWGGLGMVVGFGMLLLFAHYVWKPIAAIVAGAGLGAFIDELGKFITNDHDYFYRPAIAMIYGIFIGLFLLAQLIDRRREPTAADHLFTAVQGIQWQAIGKLDKERQRIALDHLDASGVSNPVTASIREMLESAVLVDQAEPSLIFMWRQRPLALYWTILRKHWFTRIVVAIIVVRSVQTGATLLLGITSQSFNIGGTFSSEWGALATAVASGVLGILGLAHLAQGARVSALHAFAGSTLISLLFGQFFTFAANQFAAFGSLVVELIILGLIRFALSAESSRHGGKDDPGGENDPASGIGRLL